jgi:hypothetical protein
VGVGQKKKFKKKKQQLRGKTKVNLCSTPWLAQGQAWMKKVHPSMHHPSRLVHWWVLLPSGHVNAIHIDRAPCRFMDAQNTEESLPILFLMMNMPKKHM